MGTACLGTGEEPRVPTEEAAAAVALSPAEASAAPLGSVVDAGEGESPVPAAAAGARTLRPRVNGAGLPEGWVFCLAPPLAGASAAGIDGGEDGSAAGEVPTLGRQRAGTSDRGDAPRGEGDGVPGDLRCCDDVRREEAEMMGLARGPRVPVTADVAVVVTTSDGRSLGRDELDAVPSLRSGVRRLRVGAHECGTHISPPGSGRATARFGLDEDGAITNPEIPLNDGEGSASVERCLTALLQGPRLAETFRGPSPAAVVTLRLRYEAVEAASPPGNPSRSR